MKNYRISNKDHRDVYKLQLPLYIFTTLQNLDKAQFLVSKDGLVSGLSDEIQVHLTDLFVEDNHKAIVEFIRLLFEKMAPITCFARICSPEGNCFNVLLKGELVSGENYARILIEKLDNFISLSYDNSECIKFIDSSPIGFFHIELSGKILFVNLKASKLTGYSKAEILKINVKDLFLRDLMLNDHSDLHISDIDDAEILECGILTKTGGSIPVEIHKNSIKDGSSQLFVIDISKRKAYEKTLFESVESLGKGLQGSGTGWWDWDIKRNSLYYSQSWWGMLGYNSVENNTSPDTWKKYVYPDDLEETIRKLNLAIHSVEMGFSIETRMVHQSGKVIHIMVRGAIWRDPEGTAIRVSAINSDISEFRYRILEKQIRENEYRFRTIIEKSSSLIVILDEQGNLTYVSPHYQNISGRASFEVFGRNGYENIHPDDVDGVKKSFMQIIRDPSSVENITFRQKSKDGEYLWMECIGTNLLADPVIQGVIINIRNVTEREKALEELKFSESKYRKLHQSMMDGFALVDFEGRFIEFNDTYKNMLGYEDSELYGLNFLDITPPRWHALLRKIYNEQVLSRGYSDVFEKEYIKRDGTVLPVEIRAFLIEDIKGANTSMWAIIRDISKRKESEKALRDIQIREGEEIERHRISQEIHDHIGHLMIGLKLRIENCIQREQDAEKMDYLNDTLNIAINTIRELRQISTLSPEFDDEPIDLHSAIRELLAQFEANHKININSKIEKFRVPIPAKVGINLIRIIEESLSNVSKHSNASELRIFLKKVEGKLKMMIRDNGVGLNHSVIPMGSGLFFMKKRAQMIGANISYKSKQGKYFEIRLEMNLNSMMSFY
jgi:PAS domain S-box-containing protein